MSSSRNLISPAQQPLPHSQKVPSEAASGTLQEENASWGKLPIEWTSANAHSWGFKRRIMRIFATLRCLCVAPQQSFHRIHEPIRHAAIIRFLAVLRLPLWGILLVFLVGQWLLSEVPDFNIRPIHDHLDPYLAEVLSLWFLLLIPLGIPFLYFFLGLATHVSLAITGGANQSFSATMRASGFSLAVIMIGIGLGDIPLYLQVCPGWALLAVIVFFVLFYIWQLTNALMGTQQISLLRGLAAAILPALILGGILFVRGMLEVPSFPGWAPPPFLPYIVP